MNDSPSPSASSGTPAGDWLEALLARDAAEHAARYVDDDGFTAALMQRLPAPVVLPAWRKPVVIALWLVAAALVATMLPAAVQDLAREAIRFVAAKPVSLSTLGMVLAAIAAATTAGTALALRRD
jgi:hypothetical protein